MVGKNLFQSFVKAGEFTHIYFAYNNSLYIVGVSSISRKSWELIGRALTMRDLGEIAILTVSTLVRNVFI